ncbi:ribosomal protein L37AE/L43A [Mycobacterium sp. AZCC_0083]|nr:ribosomal protein L37AE/L43A [Mycobacterium sp. AZCC_0083]
MTVCCEHNRCPERPKRWLRRFRTRPWYCPQCEGLWVTEAKTVAWFDDIWVWKEIR